MVDGMKELIDAFLDSKEEVFMVFQSSPKIHISLIFWYFIYFLVAGAVLQFLLQFFLIEWNALFSMIVLFAIIICSEILRQKTQYYITDKRIIKSIDLGFYHGMDNFYFTDFSEIYLWTRYGWIIGYENFHMKRTGLLDNFFNHVKISGLEDYEAKKILDVLESILVGQDNKILKR